MAEPASISSGMFIETFRKAAKRHGKYCPIKNELLVRKGRKTYRFICGNGELRLEAPGRPEVVFLIAPDATVLELNRAIATLTD